MKKAMFFASVLTSLFCQPQQPGAQAAGGSAATYESSTTTNRAACLRNINAFARSKNLVTADFSELSDGFELNFYSASGPKNLGENDIGRAVWIRSSGQTGTCQIVII